MKTKHWLLLFFVAVIATITEAQTVSGNVYLEDSSTEAVGATVRVKGTNTGTVTGLNGEYSIEAENGSTLIVSYVGFTPQERVVDGTTQNFTLVSDTALDAVIVTAMGIEKEKEALGYSFDEVSSEQLQQSTQDNLVNALQGQTTGALISSTGGGPGQSARITIRGINTFSDDNEPLFVVDGIPIDNSTLTVGGGAVRNMSNRAADINPNDVESVTVLKGGAATAIYGSRASNGAIVITTKRGQQGKGRINFNTTFSSEKINKFPETQKVYGQGYFGEYDPNSFWPTWGASVDEVREIDPTQPSVLYNNYENAYQTGNKYTADLSFSGGSEKGTFLLSGGYLTHEGTIPFSNFEKLNFRAVGDLQVNDKVKVSANAQFINSGGDRVNADRYNESLTYWSPRVNVNDYIFEDGTMKGYRNDGKVGNNPIYGAKTNKFQDNVNRLLGNTQISYDIAPWVTANYRVGIDTYSDFRKRFAPGPTGLAGENVHEDNELGFVYETPIRRTNFNSNGYLKFNHSVGDWKATLMVGNEVLDNKYSRVTTEGNILDIYDLYHLSNAKDITTSQYEEQRREVGAYGDLSLEYKDFLYLTFTGRNDWNSTLPQDNNSTFFPSASLSYVASENLNLPEQFSYLKFRTSYAEIGKSVAPYLVETVYFPQDGFPFANENGVSVNGWTRSNQLGAPDLRPEIIKTFDIGTDIGFFNDRLGVDFTYYRSLAEDLIIDIPVTTSSGYSQFAGNAGSIENKGVEIQLTGTPVQTSDWNVNMAVNFSSNKGEVVEVSNATEEFQYGAFYGYSGSTAYMNFKKGLEYGNITGRVYKRLGDEDDIFVDTSKPIVIGADGFPVRGDSKIIGNSQPDWFGSFNTTVSYKNFSLNALFDTRQGSMKYNQMGNFLAAFGIAEYTLDRNETKVFDGVLADGTPNTKEVWLGQGIGPDGVDYGNGYYRNYYRGVTENFVEDADWWRLRNVSLSYQLPKEWLGKVAQDASIGISGYNLWLKTDYSGFDPEGIASGNSNADGFGGFNWPGSKNITFKLSVTPF